MGSENKGCLFGFLGIFSEKTSESQDKNVSLPYRKRDDFLSDAELSFYKVLSLAVGDQFAILAKVAMKDLLFVQRKGLENSETKGFQNKISQKHVDFVLCEPQGMKPELVIELDDSSHSNKKAIERDQFKNSAFAAANLQLLRVKVKRSYSPEELQRQILSVVSGSNMPPKKVIEVEESTSQHCPKCGSEMILKKAKKGPHKGNQFWACPNFPKCKAIVPID